MCLKPSAPCTTEPTCIIVSFKNGDPPFTISGASMFISMTKMIRARFYTSVLYESDWDRPPQRQVLAGPRTELLSIAIRFERCATLCTRYELAARTMNMLCAFGWKHITTKNAISVGVWLISRPPLLPVGCPVCWIFASHVFLETPVRPENNAELRFRNSVPRFQCRWPCGPGPWRHGGWCRSP